LNGGLPANGSYDLMFTLFNTNCNGAAIAGPVTNSATVVSNGLFTATIDFGAGVFAGSNCWLEIAVQTNGGGGFTTLAPRQQVTPTPYAIYSANAGTAITASTAGSATTASSATSATTAATANNFSGSLAGDVTGTQGSTVVSGVGGQSAASVASGTAAANAATSANTPNTIVQRDASGNFVAGTITAASYSGSGAGLTNLNATAISSGTIPTGVLTSGTTNLPGHLLVVTGGTREITFNGQSLTNIQGSNVVGTVTQAITATTATSATTATTADNFSGSLTGDVTGTQGATVVSSVGGQSAASVASGAAAANAATSANNPNTIVQRDASGNFGAGSISATSFSGDGSALTNLNASQLAGGIVADGLLSTNVALLDGANVFNGTNSFTGPVIVTNSTSQFSGTFNGTVVGSVTATNFSGSFSGNGSGLTNIQSSSISGGLNYIANTNGTAYGQLNVTSPTSGNDATMAITGGGLQFTTTSPSGTVTNFQANTNGSVTFPGGVSVNAGLTSSNSYILGNRAVNPLTNFPVAAMFPVNPNSPMALDLMPSTGASDYFANGVSWIDICSTNCLTNNPPLSTLRLQISSSSGVGAAIGTMGFNGANGGYLSIIENGSQQIWFNGNTIYFYTSIQPIIDGSMSIGGSQSRWSNLYLRQNNYLMGSNSAVVFGTNSDAILSRATAGTLQISTNLNVIGTLSANSLTVTNNASIKTNTAAFGTVSQSITLGSTFTNLMGGRADFVGQFTFNLSATGSPILVISNLTTGLVITNEIPGASGTAMQGVVFPDASPNDICEAFDASSGTGASVSFVQGWWIVK
jgi:hypothetical protein